jgi:hypothetical protein
MPSRSLRWPLVVCAAAALLFFARMSVRVDPDVFFHLKEGGRVLSEGRMPTVEDYSFTRAAQPMVATEWLSGAIFSICFGLGGYPLLAIFCASLLGATLWSLTLLWDDDGPDTRVRALLIAIAAFGLLNFALAKVQNFTFVFFALDLVLVRRWDKGDRRAPWLMAALLAPWVNLHGGFMLGWVLLGGVCGLDLLKNRRAAALAPFVAGTVACCLHPNGWHAFVYPIWFFFAAPPTRAVVVEWKRLGLHIQALPYALALAAVVCARVDRLNSRFPWAAMVVVFFILGLRTVKMLPFFTLSAVAAAGMTAGLRRYRPLALPGAAVILLTIAGIQYAEARELSSYGPVSDWTRMYPRVALEHWAERDAGKRLFHHYNWGGYLLWAMPPGSKVFIDGRLEPYWTLLPDYDTMVEARPGWRELLAKYRIDTALLVPHCPLADALRAEPGWRAVGDDGRAVLFERADGPKTK